MTRTLVPVADTATRPFDADLEADLVSSHLPLVEHLVREVVRRVPMHVNRDDLSSAAMYALAAAARSFDQSLGVPFASFASLRIRGALTDELRSLDWASRSVRSKSRTVEQAREALAQSLGRLPTDIEIASTLDMSVHDLGTLRANIERATVLRTDAPGPDASVLEIPDVTDGPESLLLRREQLGYLRDAIAELPDRLRTVVEQYFFGQRLMADIARDLGVTESRVSQLRREALTYLREGMASADDIPHASVPARGRDSAVASYRAAVASRSSAYQRLSASLAG